MPPKRGAGSPEKPAPIPWPKRSPPQNHKTVHQPTAATTPKSSTQPVIKKRAAPVNLNPVVPTTPTKIATATNKRKTPHEEPESAITPALMYAPAKPSRKSDNLSMLDATCVSLIEGLLWAVQNGVRVTKDFQEEFEEIHANFWLSHFLTLGPDDELKTELVTLTQLQHFQIAYVLALEAYLKKESTLPFEKRHEMAVLKSLIKTLEAGRWDKKSNDFFKLHVELMTQLFVASYVAAGKGLDPVEFFILSEGYYGGSADQAERNHKKMLTMRGKKFKEDIAKGVKIVEEEPLGATFIALNTYLSHVYEAVEMRVVKE
ncbi:hypothetical protein HDU98_001315, partial [Podochytrium sp. JEL0797]